MTQRGRASPLPCGESVMDASFVNGPLTVCVEGVSESDVDALLDGLRRLGDEPVRAPPDPALCLPLPTGTMLLCRSGRAPTLRHCLALFAARDFDADFAAGCADFTRWPCSDEELALRVGRLRAAARPPRDRRDAFLQFQMIGASPCFLAALELLRKVADCDAPVLISGETGTGKELAARALHYRSARAGGPFLPVNCGALPADLVENELFGHRRGAFTGAVSGAGGLIDQAQRGSLFLDEVEALPAKAQVALLRFLEDHRYRRLGGGRTRSADVRIVAASNADLAERVAGGAFRQDLYFRLNVLGITLPPLREREGDVALLAKHFLREFSERRGQDLRIDDDAVAALESRYWEGNVRELRNAVQRACLLCDGDRLGSEAFATELSADVPDPQNFGAAKAAAIARFERRFLDRLLRQSAGNVTAAARAAGKERRALGRLMKKHAIDRRRYLPGGSE